MRRHILAVAIAVVAVLTATAQAQQPTAADYVVGPRDVLVVTSYDQSDLTGKFTVQTDGTFTYPLVGRVPVGGATLRQVEARLKKELVDGGLFKSPDITVSMDAYRSRQVFIVGEVRTPGAYPMSGDMRLMEALAFAGSTLPTASAEAVIVPAVSRAQEVRSSVPGAIASDTDQSAEGVTRVNLMDLAKGESSQNVLLNPGDTVFVLRAQNVFVFGQVKSPGAYPLQQTGTTVLQVLSMAGGITDRGAMGRIKIMRIVRGTKQEVKVDLGDDVFPLDTIVVPERFF